MLKGVRSEDRIDVRYEDLCADPEGTLRSICDWLQLEYSEDMLRLRLEDHHSIAGNRIRLSRGMEIRRDEKWREHLSPSDLRVFKRIAGRDNRLLGYPDS